MSDQEPRTAKDQVFALPFISDGGKADLDEMLQAVLDRVKAPRARAHVEELLIYLNWQFGDGTMVDDGEEPYLAAVGAELLPPRECDLTFTISWHREKPVTVSRTY